MITDLSNIIEIKSNGNCLFEDLWFEIKKTGNQILIYLIAWFGSAPGGFGLSSLSHSAGGCDKWLLEVHPEDFENEEEKLVGSKKELSCNKIL